MSWSPAAYANCWRPWDNRSRSYDSLAISTKMGTDIWKAQLPYATAGPHHRLIAIVNLHDVLDLVRAFHSVDRPGA